MATLYITELVDTTSSRNAQELIYPMTPPVVSQTVAIAGASAASAAFNAQTKFVRLFTDTACGIEFGAAPTAVATSGRMAANTTEYWGVQQGQSHKVAVITP